MRRLYADREEKRVTRGSDISGQDGEQEQLDVNDPNQRSLLRCLSRWRVKLLERSQELLARVGSRMGLPDPQHP